MKGPKSNISVEMAVSAKPASEVYSYGEPIERISILKSNIEGFEKRMGEIDEEMKKAKSKQKQTLQLEKVDLTNKLQVYRDELVEA